MLFDREAAAYLHEPPVSGTMSLRDYDEEGYLLEAEVLVNRHSRLSEGIRRTSGGSVVGVG